MFDLKQMCLKKLLSYHFLKLKFWIDIFAAPLNIQMTRQIFFIIEQSVKFQHLNFLLNLFVKTFLTERRFQTRLPSLSKAKLARFSLKVIVVNKTH